MTYAVKEIFYTLQGEGANAGRPAVFCRFTGCNLWSGREEDRATAACTFCDTDFVGTNGEGGGKFASAADLAAHVSAAWDAPRPQRGRPLVVCTGGEPLLQLDSALVDAFHDAGFEIAVETNGTHNPPRGIDWVCVSPKGTTELVLTAGHELKLVFPQPDAMPERFEHLDFGRLFLQPMDGPMVRENTKAAIEYCLKKPHWSLSLQTHKLLGVP